MSAELTKGEYEGHVAQTLRRLLIQRNHGIKYDGDILVEEIRLDRSGPRHMVEILFRDDARPQCLFGWRFPATEADEPASAGADGPMPAWEAGMRGKEQADNWTTALVLTNFQEEVEAAGYGLPDECLAGAITWIGEHKP